MKKEIVLVIFLSFLFTAKSQNSWLATLDSTLNERSKYFNQKENEIKQLKKQLKIKKTSFQKYIVCKQIYSEYQKYMCDSAIYYLNLSLDYATELHNSDYTNKTKLELILMYASSGVFEESIIMLNTLQPQKFNKQLKFEYYTTCENIYGELRDFATDKRNILKYESKRKCFEDSIVQMKLLPTERELEIKEANLLKRGKLNDALRINNARLKITPNYDSRFSMIAFERFLIERQRKDVDEQKKYLVLSTISDIRNSIRNNASLCLLATLLHSEGEIDRAYKYIKIVQEDAAFFHGRLRYIQVANIMPIIEESYRVKSDKQKKNIILLLICISCLTLFLGLTMFILYKQKQKISKANIDLQFLNDKLIQLNEELRALNHELSSVNHIKEEYIGQFLSICSIYIVKLDSMRKLVLRKIANGKMSDLQKDFSSNEIIDSEIEEFYKNFDEVFLHIFPDFVTDFNNLLYDGEQIELKSGELLTVELRIFALIRLGINDSAKIAKLLRYSVNTIYNYRAKVKNKAKVSREDFELLVLKIGSFNV